MAISSRRSSQVPSASVVGEVLGEDRDRLLPLRRQRAVDRRLRVDREEGPVGGAALAGVLVGALQVVDARADVDPARLPQVVAALAQRRGTPAGGRRPC